MSRFVVTMVMDFHDDKEPQLDREFPIKVIGEALKSSPEITNIERMRD